MFPLDDFRASCAAVLERPDLGGILQLGSPTDVYYRPRSEFVARFFGDNNLVEGTLGGVDGNRRLLETAIGQLACSCEGTPELLAAPAGARAFAVIRPEAIRLDTGTGWGSAAPDTALAEQDGARAVEPDRQRQRQHHRREQ